MYIGRCIVFDRIMVKLAYQRNMSPRIGALINIYQTTAILYAPLTLIGVATTIYGLWGAELIRGYLPWFTVYHLIGIMVGLILVLMIFFYKVIIPSIVAFSVQQNYKHRNPMVVDLQNILQNQADILKEIRNVKDRLGRLDGGKGEGD